MDERPSEGGDPDRKGAPGAVVGLELQAGVSACCRLVSLEKVRRPSRHLIRRRDLLGALLVGLRVPAEQAGSGFHFTTHPGTPPVKSHSSTVPSVLRKWTLRVAPSGSSLLSTKRQLAAPAPQGGLLMYRSAPLIPSSFMTPAAWPSTCVQARVSPEPGPPSRLSVSHVPGPCVPLLSGTSTFPTRSTPCAGGPS